MIMRGFLQRKFLQVMKHNKNIFILGIESSCDDTSAAITFNNKVISNIVSSQKIHRKFGGVVPELASRSHQNNI
jgi:N6-L-threonylcarbamoyladenine synthase